eukprot:COSAG06_NODE_39469_length_412_cov_0.821086_1_plen_37_part_10
MSTRAVLSLYDLDRSLAAASNRSLISSAAVHNLHHTD